MSTTPQITDIRAYVEVPADPYGSDWDWAEASTAVWKLAAGRSGYDIEDETWEGFDVNTVASRVKIGGAWFDLEVGRRGDPSEVYAIEA